MIQYLGGIYMVKETPFDFLSWYSYNDNTQVGRTAIKAKEGKSAFEQEFNKIQKSDLTLENFARLIGCLVYKKLNPILLHWLIKKIGPEIIPVLRFEVAGVTYLRPSGEKTQGVILNTVEGCILGDSGYMPPQDIYKRVNAFPKTKENNILHMIMCSGYKEGMYVLQTIGVDLKNLSLGRNDHDMTPVTFAQKMREAGIADRHDCINLLEELVDTNSIPNNVAQQSSSNKPDVSRMSRSGLKQSLLIHEKIRRWKTNRPGLFGNDFPHRNQGNSYTD